MVYLKFSAVLAVLATSTHGYANIPEVNLSQDAPVPQSTGAVPFDAQSQYVSNTGIHEFIAPGEGDARGPCPGLNVMANHGYLPRSGLALISQFIAATNEVFGMGSDLSIVLAAYGAIFDGAALLWSIAGTEHTGIGGSHNNYESDSSPTRADLAQYGSNTDLIISQFTELYNMQPDPATANYNLDILKEFRATRFNESIAKNPNFFYAPFSGTVVTSAAFSFIYRFMGNKSAEYPEGYLNQDVLKSFFSIQGSADNLTWVPGHERIPDNWYKLNEQDNYTLQKLIADLQFIGQGQEYVLQPGCNMGKVNSFVQINETAMAGGAYGSSDPATNAFCFGLAYAVIASGAVPGLGLSDLVSEFILPVQNALGCETVQSLNMTAAQACPGYSFYGGPTGPVASGAIQS